MHNVNALSVGLQSAHRPLPLFSRQVLVLGGKGDSCRGAFPMVGLEKRGPEKASCPFCRPSLDLMMMMRKAQHRLLAWSWAFCVESCEAGEGARTPDGAAARRLPVLIAVGEAGRRSSAEVGGRRGASEHLRSMSMSRPFPFFFFLAALPSNATG